MDRAIPVMSMVLHEKWIEKDRQKLQKTLLDIGKPVFSGRTPNPIPHQRDQARLRKLLKAPTSRKHRIEEEKQDKINHENKLLYKKMTEILKKGSGSCSPPRRINGKHNTATFGQMRSLGPGNLRQDTDSVLMQHGRSVTARPSHQMIRRLANQRENRTREQIL